MSDELPPRDSAPAPRGFDAMSREELLRALEMFAKNWLAHDGCWFLAAEERHGLAEAIELDRRSWERFADIEARRIVETFGIARDGGLPSLASALALRMYTLVNAQHVEWSPDGRRLRFVMDACRVQEARRRRNLPPFPCKPVGAIEFDRFARAVDPRIRTACVHCPPDAAPGQACAWEFSLDASPRQNR